MLDKKKARMVAVGVALGLLVVAMEMLALHLGTVELPIPGTQTAVAERP